MDLLEVILSLDPQKAKNALNILDPLSREVLNLLLKKRVALTTQQIIDALVEEWAEEILTKYNEIMNEYRNKLDDMERGGKDDAKRTWRSHLWSEASRFGPPSSIDYEILKARYDNLNVTLFEDRFYPEKVTITFKRLRETVEDYLKKVNKEEKLTKSEMIKLKKELVGNLCEIPSFRRLEQSILPELEAMGLVVSRPPVGKMRAKKLYAANPALFDVLDKE